MAFLTEITRAPTAVSVGVAASFAPRLNAIKKDKAKPTMSRTILVTTAVTPVVARAKGL